MDRRDFVQILRYDVNHKWKTKKSKVRTVLESIEFEEIGGKLTEDEVRHIFGETELYGIRKFKRNGIDLILVCRDCGRYTILKWYYEDVPDINELWETLLVENRLFSPGENIFGCMEDKHNMEIRPYEDLEAIKRLKYDLREAQGIDDVITMMSR